MYSYHKDQYLIGTVFGGSSLTKPKTGKNYYLSMRSSNLNWLKYKAAHIPYFEDAIVTKTGNTYRCVSKSSPEITDMYKVLYKKNKRVALDSVMDSFFDTGLGVWFLDAGGKTGRNKKNAYINTTLFGTKGTKKILKWFQSLNSDLAETTINHDKNRLKILFSVKGTENFFKTIANTFPPFMYHRL